MYRKSSTLCGLFVCSTLCLATGALVLAARKAARPDPAGSHWLSATHPASGDDRTRTFVLDGKNLATLAVAFLVAALANAAGVGGGAAMVPLFNVMLGFGLKASTALAQAAITGGSIASVVFSIFKRHPLDESKPVLDFELGLLLTPMLLLGISAGVMVNAILPDWLLVLLLTILLSYVTQRTTRKGVQLFVVEHKLAQARRLNTEYGLIYAAVSAVASLVGVSVGDSGACSS
ncbi:hypothetical protein WJX72_011784 [[Myrmecia] bisecta]|uniref:Membrane transporter protein n=1 Tax=[Myrmecia] bisecta TaxID=41462 RepID=A0AAW1QGN3_9CHLO